MEDESDEESVEATLTDLTGTFGIDLSSASLSFLKKNNIIKKIAVQRAQCVERAGAQTKPRSKLEDFDVRRMAIKNTTTNVQGAAVASPAKHHCTCELCEGVIATPATFKECGTKSGMK